MARTPSEWRAVELSQDSLTLLLGWRPRARRLEAQWVEVNTDVADELRIICRETLDRLGSLTAIPYEGTAILNTGEEFFHMPIASTALREVSNPGQDAERDDESTEVADLLAIVQNPGSREQMLPGQVRDGTFLFYAVICADSEGNSVAFVKQQHNLRVARTGRLLTMFGDRLTRVTDPVFAFGHDFDLVLTAEEMVILRPDAYLRLFTDIEALAAGVPSFIAQVGSRVSAQLSSQARSVLETECKAKPSLGKRLRKLSNRPWLEQITPETLEAAIAKSPDLPEGVTIAGGTVYVAEGCAEVLLSLLEQVYWVGDYDQKLRAAQAYSTVSRGGSEVT